MRTFNKLTSRNSRYLFAFASVMAAAAIRLALHPFLEHESPLLLFTLPVVVSALYAGFGPAIFATVLGGFMGTYLFVGGIGMAEFSSANHVRILLFFGIGLTISLLGKKLRSSQNELQQSAARLQEEARRKDEFLAMLAHELRNPLAGISTAAELLKFVRLDENRLTLTSDVITRQVGYMVMLVDDLLDVSRFIRGLTVIEKNPLDLREIVQSAVDQVRSLIDAQGHHLTLQMTHEPARVRGDAIRLVQVIANFLSNAAKYTPPGGSIALRVNAGQDYVELSVQDNGTGLAPELLPNVFDLFVQAKRTIDRSQGGLGLGLPLVRNIIELHGGKVIAESEGVGKGSRFAFRLPRLKKSDEDEPPRVVNTARSATGTSLNILVVDDNRDAAQSLAMLLEAQGHTVFVEHDAKNALGRAYAERVDVSLLDIGLPDIDGYELARRLRLIPNLSRAVLVAITGYGQAEDRARTKAAGFDHHFVKPVNPSSLAELLMEISQNIRKPNERPTGHE